MSNRPVGNQFSDERDSGRFADLVAGMQPPRPASQPTDSRIAERAADSRPEPRGPAASDEMSRSPKADMLPKRNVDRSNARDKEMAPAENAAPERAAARPLPAEPKADKPAADKPVARETETAPVADAMAEESAVSVPAAPLQPVVQPFVATVAPLAGAGEAHEETGATALIAVDASRPAVPQIVTPVAANGNEPAHDVVPAAQPEQKVAVAAETVAAPLAEAAAQTAKPAAPHAQGTEADDVASNPAAQNAAKVVVTRPQTATETAAFAASTPSQPRMAPLAEPSVALPHAAAVAAQLQVQPVAAKSGVDDHSANDDAKGGQQPALSADAAQKPAVGGDFAKAELRPDHEHAGERVVKPEPVSAQSGTQPAQTHVAPPALPQIGLAAEVQAKLQAMLQAPPSHQAVTIDQVPMTIAARAAQGNTQFDIRLEPQDLGRIDVRMQIDKDGFIKTHLVVESRETYELLQRDQRQLERTLGASGMKTAEGGIELSLKSDGGGQQDRQFAFQQNRDDQRPRASSSQSDFGGDAAHARVPDVVAQNYHARMAANRGGIDVKI